MIGVFLAKYVCFFFETKNTIEILRCFPWNKAQKGFECLYQFFFATSIYFKTYDFNPIKIPDCITLRQGMTLVSLRRWMGDVAFNTRFNTMIKSAAEYTLLIQQLGQIFYIFINSCTLLSTAKYIKH